MTLLVAAVALVAAAWLTAYTLPRPLPPQPPAAHPGPPTE